MILSILSPIFVVFIIAQTIKSQFKPFQFPTRIEFVISINYRWKCLVVLTYLVSQKFDYFLKN